jgi:hypothetical protein
MSLVQSILQRLGRRKGQLPGDGDLDSRANCRVACLTLRRLLDLNLPKPGIEVSLAKVEAAVMEAKTASTTALPCALVSS